MQIYTEDSLAQLMSCSKRTIQEARRRGELEYFSLGRRKDVRFTQEQVDKWIASRSKCETYITDIQRAALTYCRAHPAKI